MRKVYEKTAGRKSHKKQVSENLPDLHEENKIQNQCIYQIGVLQLDYRENTAVTHEQSMSRDMLVHLLEEIVNRYQMGTLFAPYNCESFIMFQQDKALPEGERRKTLDNWLRLLEKNISQYLTETLILGLSMEFTALPETREQYEKAVLAAEQHFFS